MLFTCPATGPLAAVLETLDAEYESTREALAAEAAITSQSSYRGRVVHPLRRWLDMFVRVAHGSIERLAIEGTQHRGGLLDALTALSRHRELMPVYLADAESESKDDARAILPHLLACLSAKRVARPVVNAVLDVLEVCADC